MKGRYHLFTVKNFFLPSNLPSNYPLITVQENKLYSYIRDHFEKIVSIYLDELDGKYTVDKHLLDGKSCLISFKKVLPSNFIENIKAQEIDDRLHHIINEKWTVELDGNERNSPTNLPTINPLITHGKKELYDMINAHYPRIVKDVVVGRSGVDFPLDYVKSTLFSPKTRAPTKNTKNALFGELKRQLNTKKTKNRGLDPWVDNSLSEKVKEIKAYVQDHDDADYKELCISFNQKTIDKLIEKGDLIKLPVGTFECGG